jgi:hypothetical protein
VAVFDHQTSLDSDRANRPVRAPPERSPRSLIRTVLKYELVALKQYGVRLCEVDAMGLRANQPAQHQSTSPAADGHGHLRLRVDACGFPVASRRCGHRLGFGQVNAQVRLQRLPQRWR